MLKDGHLVVFGGTGSFGHKVAKVFADSEKISSVTIFSRDEKKQDDMRRRFPDFRYIVGDIRDYEAVKQALRGATVVFQAAALKQVPSCEKHPLEALKTNCLGVANVCQAAWETPSVESVVALSTDKAVQPVNAMGISKAMAEKIVTSQPLNGPRFMCVRYGNVLGTRGSIMPVWLKQYQQKQPLTITDPQMTRFVMNLSDSVALVKYAYEHPHNGSTYVWPASALTINMMAELFREFLNDPTYPIEVIGRRPGEKMHEVLICEDELHRTSVGLGNYVEVFSSLATAIFPSAFTQPFASNTAPAPTNFLRMLIEARKDMEHYPV